LVFWSTPTISFPRSWIFAMNDPGAMVVSGAAFGARSRHVGAGRVVVGESVMTGGWSGVID
jgi:hypothetical protein